MSLNAAAFGLVSTNSAQHDRCVHTGSIQSGSSCHLTPDALLASILEACHFARYIVTADGYISTWCRAAEQLLGFTAEEIIGQHTSVLMPSTFHDSWRRNFNAISSTRVIHVDSIRRHKDGRLISVEVTAAALMAPDGSLYGVLVTLHDKRQLVEQQEKNAQLATIVNASPIAMVGLDGDRKIRTWNAAAEDLFGYTLAEVAGQHMEVIVPTERRDEAVRMAQQNITVDYESVRRSKSGKDIVVNVIGTPIMNSAGGATGWALFYRDLTAKKKAESDLKASEAFARSLLQASVDWISVIDEDGRVVYTNRSSDCDQTTKQIQAVARSWIDLWPPNQRTAIAIASAEARQSGAARITVMRRDANDRVVWYDLHMILLPESSAEQRLLAMARDITTKKQDDDHIGLMVKELSHRAKNLLAVINAMARSTTAQCRSVAEFEVAFCARILGLSRSHDLLVTQDWRGAQLLTLVRQHLSPFMDVNSNRLRVSGVNVMLQPAMAQALGMVLHELATNAVKYGALSNSTGCIHMSCANVGGKYEIEWSETGGPIVRAPASCGFGSVVVEDMASEAFSCEARIEFRPSGVVWSARLCGDAIVPWNEGRGGPTIADSKMSGSSA